MGVPTVTRVGPTHLTPEGYALLKHVGLADLGAATDEEYVAAAARLAGDVPRLRLLRRGLRRRLRASPLMDGAGLARRVEAACGGCEENLLVPLTRLLPVHPVSIQFRASGDR